MRKTLSWFYFAVVVCILMCAPTAADDSCDVAGNLTYNCNFDRFVDLTEGGSRREVPEGWTPWVTGGDPAFDVDDHGSAPGAPAQRIWSDGGSWTAGLYQQVPVSPDRAYVARIDWVAISAPDIERKLGIDPLGGVDPLSPGVIWGPSTWGEEKMPDLRVTAFAAAPTITVFVWTHHSVSHGQDQVFLDAVTLVEDPSLVAPTVPPSPTPTRRPPTRTPSPVPATETPTVPPASPVPTETPLPTETPVPEPTEVPPTATPTMTPAPSPVPPTETPTTAPTPTPTSTEVSIAVLVPTPGGGSSSGAGTATRRAMPPEAVVLYVAVVSLVVAALLVGAALWLWIQGRKPSDS